MRRIVKSYENRLLALLGRAKAPDMDAAAQSLRQQAEELRARDNIPLLKAYEQVYERTRHGLASAGPNLHPWAGQQPAPHSAPPHFLCDTGLGGLARWLRAAGYEADWIPDVDDHVLLQEAQRRGAILLTTDTGLLERRLLRDGIIPTLWLSPAFTIEEHLKTVLHELRLPLLPPRCMKCGGNLLPANKEELQERIPPKTYLWRNEFFLCEKCGHLFWHGTHWEKIQAQLAKATEIKS